MNRVYAQGQDILYFNLLYQKCFFWNFEKICMNSLEAHILNKTRFFSSLKWHKYSRWLLYFLLLMCKLLLFFRVTNRKWRLISIILLLVKGNFSKVSIVMSIFKSFWVDNFQSRSCMTALHRDWKVFSDQWEKYRNFTWFAGVDILRKGTVSA